MVAGVVLVGDQLNLFVQAPLSSPIHVYVVCPQDIMGINASSTKQQIFAAGTLVKIDMLLSVCIYLNNGLSQLTIFKILLIGKPASFFHDPIPKRLIRGYSSE